MSDYIKREDVERWVLTKCFSVDTCPDREDAVRRMRKEISPADVRENVKAHWIDMKPTGDDRFMCSRCKWKEKVPTIMGEPIVWDYCPSCGAVMRGES